MGIFRIHELQTQAEGTFLENAASLGSLTFDTELVPILDGAQFAPDEGRVDDPRVLSRLNESFPQFQTVRGGTLTFETYLYGHNSPATGALTETALSKLLAAGLGGGDTTAVGTTSNGGGSATDVDPAGGTLVDGAGVLVNGEYGVCDGTTGTLFTALSAAPGASDVIHAALTVYPTEGEPNYRRFLIGHTDSGSQYALLGCALESLSLTFPTGDMPRVSQTWRIGWWDKLATTIPSGNQHPTANAAPLAAGSVYLQDVGTTTRNEIEPYEIGLTIDMGLQPRVGPGAPVINCDKRGWVRTLAQPTFTAKVPFTDAYDSIWQQDGDDTVHKHVLVTCSPTAGRSVGFYLPRAYAITERPIVEEQAEQTAVMLSFRGREGTDTANDLTRSAFRIFLG